MDGASLSRFPHLSWLGYGFDAGKTEACAWNLNGSAHALHIVLRGRGDVRWISRGREVEYAVEAGSFHYLPADDESHVIAGTFPEGTQSFTLFIPRQHLNDIAAADDIKRRVEHHRILTHDDAVLQATMMRLANAATMHEEDAQLAHDEAARRLVLRLVELSGGGTPDWHDDASVFGKRTLGHLVEHIDAHLRAAPSVSDMAARVGLSPSHFAVKFRRSTGLSLHRFVNRRRLRASMELLKDHAKPLADVAKEVGFSSHSHLTRLFSDLVGMTPAKYRKQFKPAML